MWQWGHDGCTQPYVDRYFDEVASTAAIRSGWMLARAASGFFPRITLDEQVPSRARVMAQRPELPMPLRRALLDGADDAARVLVVRSRFPHPP